MPTELEMEEKLDFDMEEGRLTAIKMTVDWLLQRKVQI